MQNPVKAALIDHARKPFTAKDAKTRKGVSLNCSSFANLDILCVFAVRLMPVRWTVAMHERTLVCLNEVVSST